MRLLDALRGWLDASLRNRAAFTMVVISMAATAVLAAASFFASQRLIAENTLQTQRAALAAFERQLDFEGRELIRMIESMSRNAFVSNALVDSLGRDQYLLPFLRDQRFPSDWSGTLWLVDFKGRPIGSNAAKTDFPFMHSAALQSALSSGEQKMEAYEDASHLMIAAPVLFPPTKSIEGAVVAVVDFANALDHNAAVVSSDYCFRLIANGAGIEVPSGCVRSAQGPVLRQDLKLAGALAQLDPTLELYVRPRSGFSTLGIYLLAYAVVIGSVIVAVLWASRRIAARIVAPLSQVTDAANTIVRDDRLDLRVAAAGNDEVGQLAKSFNHMVEGMQAAQSRMRADLDRIRAAESRLQTLNTELEQRVGERTADLEAMIVDLNKAREEAERANKAKSDFLSRMSHELRTPLNAVLGFAQILRLRGESATGAQREENVVQIEKAGWHLLELINEVLDLSRIEAGKMSVSHEAVRLQPLCAECLQLIQPLTRAAGISVFDRTADVAPVSAFGDRTRLNQVLMNLLSNAVKYNRRGGAITLTLQAIDDDWVELGVEDTGPGFTPEQLRHLYEPFNRLGAETSATEGTGIGLVVTKRLAELMGGRLDLASTEGVGSRFTVRLKRAPDTGAASESPQAPAEAASNPPPALHATILYIEDNPSNVDVVRSAMQLRPGVRLLEAPDGPTGLEIAHKQRPDVILVDIALPGIDGYEVCRRLRARAETAATLLIAVSANAMQADIDKGMQAGFDAYLTKPIDLGTLWAQVDRRLSPPDSDLRNGSDPRSAA